MLILQNTQNEVMLQKRPATGIWGGLWSFPQFETGDQANEWLLENFNIELNSHAKLPELIHTFSHFRLTIQPYLVQIESQQQGIMEAEAQLWYNINTEFDGGLAAPITTLLKTLKKGKTHDKNG